MARVLDKDLDDLRKGLAARHAGRGRLNAEREDASGAMPIKGRSVTRTLRLRSRR